MLKLLSVLLALSVSAPAYAELISMEGDLYTETSNENGIVLTSQVTKYRVIGTGVSMRIDEGKEVFYLGRSCDAFSQRLGDGKWQWTNSGVLLEFNGGAVFSFRFELKTNDDALLKCIN